MDNWTIAQVIQPNEISECLQSIACLQQHWIKRSENYPFYTLGLAAYLDKDNKEYGNKVKRDRYNKLLLENFSGLYARLLPKLSCILNAPVKLYPEVALPGFHIYLPHEELDNAAVVHQTTPHMDVQFKFVFPDFGLKQEDFVSFTLALSCSNEAGLNIWKPSSPLPENVLDLLSTCDKIGIVEKGQIARYVAESIYNRPTFISYKPGMMFTHHGVFFHYPVLKATRVPRITLQGHGLKRNGTFLLFW